MNHRQPVGDARRRRTLESFGGSVEVVESIEQVASEGTDGVVAVGVGLEFRPFLVIEKLGPASLELVQILVTQALGFGEFVGLAHFGVLNWLRRRPGFNVFSRLGAICLGDWIRGIHGGEPSWPSRNPLGKSGFKRHPTRAEPLPR